MTNNHHQKNKERLSKKAPESYQNFSKEEKDKRRQNARERYRNLSSKNKTFLKFFS